MYAATGTPLPPNSEQPYPMWLVNAHRHKKLLIEMAAAKARAGVLCAPNPASFIDMGPQIMADVLRSPAQGTLTGPSALKAPQNTPNAALVSAPPTVVPLNTVTTVQAPVNSAPRGTPTTGTQGSGTPWGNSPVIPPGAAMSFFQSVPGWVWALAGIAGLLSIGAGQKRGRF